MKKNIEEIKILGFLGEYRLKKLDIEFDKSIFNIIDTFEKDEINAYSYTVENGEPNYENKTIKILEKNNEYYLWEESNYFGIKKDRLYKLRILFNENEKSQISTIVKADRDNFKSDLKIIASSLED
jgi:hypothetical protein